MRKTLAPENRGKSTKRGSAEDEPLVKQALAEHLREAIMSGALQPGVRIVEGTWARKLGVAQASVREAINILAQQGFVSKESGRSARVVKLTEEDVVHLYELRGALEGLAVRLAAEKKVDLARLQQTVDVMRHAARKGPAKRLLDADLAFHLELCTISGNAYLLEHAKRVLLPFFAFVRIRVITTSQDTSVWGRDIEAHQRIVDLLREGEGEVAEQYVQQVMRRFAATAYANWERKSTLRKSRR
jgi:DNA-binding GntR family transcriptional regulator